MDLAFDILTALGLGAAAGLRPYVPALLAGALAAGNVTIDFDGTDFAFLEKAWWLIAVLVLLAIVSIASRRLGAATVESGPAGAALGGVALGIGGLLGAGTLQDHGHSAILGVALGVLAAALGQAAARSLFERVRTRLDATAGDTLTLFADGAALIAAALAILVPPLSVVVLGFLAWLLTGGRRREGERFAGLRILR